MNDSQDSRGGQASKGQVTGEVLGERVCNTCGFNLHGQQIVREQHYGMLIVRCPECSAAAALEEYPSLGKWARRLTFLSAAVFLLGMLGLFFLSSILLAGFMASAQNERIAEVARAIAADHLVHQQGVQSQNATTAGAATTGVTAPGATAAAFVPYTISNLRGWEYDAIELAWWDAQDAGKYELPSTVLWAKFDRKMGIDAMFAALFALGIGCAWSVVLCGVARRRLWLVVVAIAVGAVFAYAVTLVTGASLMWGYSNGPGWKTATHLALNYASASAAWKFMGFELVIVAIGVAIGRTLARWMVQWLLPPRHVGLMGFLWACDDLPMPRGSVAKRRA